MAVWPFVFAFRRPKAHFIVWRCSVFVSILVAGAGWIGLLALYIWRRYQLRKLTDEAAREAMKPFHVIMLGLSMAASYATGSLIMRLTGFWLIGCFLAGGAVAWLVLRFMSALFAAALEDIIDRRGHR